MKYKPINSIHVFFAMYHYHALIFIHLHVCMLSFYVIKGGKRGRGILPSNERWETSIVIHIVT